jgi:hypothetical protein
MSCLVAASAAAQCPDQRLLAPEGKSGDYFGYSVDLDGTTAVIGAPYGGRGPNFSSFGIVLVYELGAGGWQLMQELEPSTGDPGMAFGHSVGVSGRWLVVGAPYEDAPSQMVNAGAAYVFERKDSRWVFFQKLRATGAILTWGQMGYSVAIDGDWMVTGAPLWSLLGSDPTGNAFAWNYVGDWQEQGWLMGVGCWDIGAGHLGESVAVSGTTIIAGAPTWNWWVICSSVASYGGAAWVRTFDATSMFYPLSNPGMGQDRFGQSVAISGERAMISAPMHPNDSFGTGVIYAYEKSSDPLAPRLVRTQKLAQPEAIQFGLAIAMSGDDALILGRELPDRIAGYHYRYVKREWILAGKLKIDDGAPQSFSALAAIDSGRAMIGMPQKDSACASLPACMDSGAVSAFQLASEVTSYCTCSFLGASGNHVSYGGCRNSTGQAAELRACGSGSAMQDDLRLECVSLPLNVPGIVVMGPRADALPYGDGILCVGPGDKGLFRFAGGNSGTQGVLTLGPGIVAYSLANFPVSGHIQPGDTWFFQTWYRDPSGPCGRGFNLSNGLQVDFTQ